MLSQDTCGGVQGLASCFVLLCVVCRGDSTNPLPQSESLTAAAADISPPPCYTRTHINSTVDKAVSVLSWCHCVARPGALDVPLDPSMHACLLSTHTPCAACSHLCPCGVGVVPAARGHKQQTKRGWCCCCCGRNRYKVLLPVIVCCLCVVVDELSRVGRAKMAAHGRDCTHTRSCGDLVSFAREGFFIIMCCFGVVVWSERSVSAAAVSHCCTLLVVLLSSSSLECVYCFLGGESVCSLYCTRLFGPGSSSILPEHARFTTPTHMCTTLCCTMSLKT